MLTTTDLETQIQDLSHIVSIFALHPLRPFPLGANSHIQGNPLKTAAQKSKLLGNCSA